MTTQPTDLKKLREVAEEVVKCAPGCNSNMVRRWYAVANPQTILALLDAYEASARDAGQFVMVPADKFALMRKALHRSAPIPEVIRTFPESRKEHDQIYAFAEELERMYAARHATQGD